MGRLKILLLRHGNTFAPGQKAVMIGAGEDLPLVASGLEQAQRMQRALRDAPAPAAVYVGPLRRTTAFGEIVAAAWSLSVRNDDRLRELDYGAWAGLSDDEIKARGEGDTLERWRAEARWPAAFGEGEAAVRARLRSFVADLGERHSPPSRILAVTSQGILKQLASIADWAGARPREFKVATGNAVTATLDRHAGLLIDGWNLTADEIARKPW